MGKVKKYYSKQVTGANGSPIGLVFDTIMKQEDTQNGFSSYDTYIEHYKDIKKCKNFVPALVEHLAKADEELLEHEMEFKTSQKHRPKHKRIAVVLKKIWFAYREKDHSNRDKYIGKNPISNEKYASLLKAYWKALDEVSKDSSKKLQENVVKKATESWESFKKVKGLYYENKFDECGGALPWWLNTPGAYEDLAPVLHEKLALQE